MADWYYCDHRAPAVLPKKSRDPEEAYLLIGVLGASSGLVTLLSWIPAMDAAAWFTYTMTVLMFVWAWCLAMSLKWIVKIPGSNTDSYLINERVREMQQIYRDRSDLREVIEPVLIATYGFARTGQLAPVEKRLAAVKELTSSSGLAVTEDTSDLDALKMFLEVRGQMRRDGLL